MDPNGYKGAGSGLSGRVAVVTGASSGIGAAVARELAGSGATVVLLARSLPKLEALADELSSRGCHATAVRADVTDRASLEHAADRVRADHGGTDILVNAAGEALLAPFGPDRTAETRRLVEVNLMGTLFATEVFLEQLRERRGDIVNLSSVGGRNARKGASVYNATKWGVTGFSEALRQELLPEVRVMVVEPGATDTPIIERGSHEGSKRAFRELYPPGSMLEAEDVAEVIAFALTRRSRVAINEILLRPRSQLY